MSQINQEDLYLFHTGNAQKAWLTFGAHKLPGQKMYQFCVWAPNAQHVSVVGEFNQWNIDSCPMKREPDGTFTACCPAYHGALYKYYIVGYDGIVRYKADPFAFSSELRPGNASRIWALDSFAWTDEEYLKKRDRLKKRSWYQRPVSVYELHLGSWKRKSDNSFYNYREIADLLVPYVKSMGFTHVELLPVTEHPFDGSWGYQVTGYYAVTSRYGTPQDFMYFVDRMHQAGIGVILDWVPAHFPRDVHGLAKFDGTCLYEHENPLQGEQPQWGTLIFNYGRPEVQSFLISAAMFFLERYHIDGLRIDAVSSMLYLDFGRENGCFVPNKDGGNLNLDAIAFLQKLNTTVLSAYPGVMMIAEESTAYPMVTKPPYDGGLGFTHKWDMGFMNDMLDYMEMDHLFRRDNHGKLTFSMLYAFSENYILPFSHDEVVHGKRSMVSKMYGDYWQQFASLRALYGYMFAHPGKKLLFMGCEFAQFIEWDEKKELDWFLDQYESHRKMSEYVKKLNRLYRKYRALYEIDDSWEGFQWMNADDNENSAAAFLRLSKPYRGKKQQLLCVVNFTPVVREHYKIALPEKGMLKCILNSDAAAFGGSGVTPAAEKVLRAAGEGFLGRASSIELTLPPLSVMYFEYTQDPEKTAKQKRKFEKRDGKG